MKFLEIGARVYKLLFNDFKWLHSFGFFDFDALCSNFEESKWLTLVAKYRTYVLHDEDESLRDIKHLNIA